MSKTKKLFLCIIISAFFAPLILGMKGTVPEVDSFYNVKGTVKSNTSGAIVGVTIFLQYSNSDTSLLFNDVFGTNQAVTDSKGDFDISDHFTYYDNNHGVVRFRVVGLKDAIIGDSLLIDSAKHNEILGKQSGCSSGSTPTKEIYTFPDQTIILP